MLAWITGCSDSSRDGSNRTHIASRLVYTPSVVADLASADIASAIPGVELNAGSSPTEWMDGLAVLDKRVLGLALLLPKSSYAVAKYITPCERIVLDYWLVSQFYQQPIIFVSIAEFVTVPEWELLEMRLGLKGSQALFNTMSPMQSRRLIARGCALGRPFSELWEQWAVRHGLNSGLYDFSSIHPVVESTLMMPLPHAALVALQSWKSWGFPCLTGQQRRGRLYHLGRPLWSGLEPGEPLSCADDTPTDQAFGPMEMETITELLRQLLMALPEGLHILLII